MQILLTLVPVLLLLLTTTLMVAGFVKLAARLLRHTTVSWKHSIVFALLLAGLALVRSASGPLVAAILPPVPALAIGLAATLGIGTWFFSTRAANAQGALLGWRGSLQLTGIALGLMLAVSLSFFLLTNAFLPPSP